MLSLEEAIARVLDAVPAPPIVEVGVADAADLVLAQPVEADADMPAFDRSAMDGYAVRSEDARAPGAKLRRVGEERPGGERLGRALRAGECAAIYTGAPIPDGADAVVMVEKTRAEGATVELAAAVRHGENVRRRGEDVRQGERLLEAGAVLRPEALAVCAFFGAPRVRVHPRPGVAVLSTGDELVPPEATPGPGLIRDSNGVMLAAQAARAGARVAARSVVRDDREAIRAAIESAAAAAEVLVLTGGVSMGAYDWVAPILGELGFAGGFHKVRVKPGKPVWFGRRGRVLAFGLPGNPVSAFVLFELMVRGAIEKLSGRAPGPRWKSARFGGGPVASGDREQVVPARLGADGSIAALPWTSSADFVELVRGDALLRVPIGAALQPGAGVQYLPL